MHIEIQNCFSFWETSSTRPPTGASPQDPTGGLLSPDPQHRTSPTFCTRFTPLETVRLATSTILSRYLLDVTGGTIQLSTIRPVKQNSISSNSHALAHTHDFLRPLSALTHSADSYIESTQ